MVAKIIHINIICILTLNQTWHRIDRRKRLKDEKQQEIPDDISLEACHNVTAILILPKISRRRGNDT